jgi:hypothetical protein
VADAEQDDLDDKLRQSALVSVDAAALMLALLLLLAATMLAMLVMGGSPVLNAVLCLLTNTPWPWPIPSDVPEDSTGKVSQRASARSSRRRRTAKIMAISIVGTLSMDGAGNDKIR